MIAFIHKFCTVLTSCPPQGLHWCLSIGNCLCTSRCLLEQLCSTPDDSVTVHPLRLYPQQRVCPQETLCFFLDNRLCSTKATVIPLQLLTDKCCPLRTTCCNPRISVSLQDNLSVALMTTVTFLGLQTVIPGMTVHLGHLKP